MASVRSCDNTSAGSSFWVSKAFTSSSITTTAQDLTSEAVGKLYVADIVLRTDAVGLAGGTNLTIQTNDTVGLAAVLTTAISGLGANKTINLDTASVTKQRTVLEHGKKLQILCTGVNCTGTGQVVIDIKFERCAPGNTIVAA